MAIALPPIHLEFSYYLLGFGPVVQIVHDHAETIDCQSLGHSAPDSSGCPGYDCDFLHDFLLLRWRPLIGSCRQKKYRTWHYINPMHNRYIAYASSTITSGRAQPSQVTMFSFNFFHGRAASRNYWSTGTSFLFY